MQFGSHVYGTNLPTSDTDVKAVHVPTGRDILLQRVRATIHDKTNTTTARNTAADTDFESFALQKFMEMLLQGQTMALNMLFTPPKWIMEGSAVWDLIRFERKHWLHSGVSAFVGYCRQQANKYGIRGGRVAAVREAIAFFEDLAARHGATAKLRDHWDEVVAFAEGREFCGIVQGEHSNGKLLNMIEVCGRKVQEFTTFKEALAVFRIIFDQYGQRALAAERNEGVDWKAVMHAVRVCGEAEELLLTHHITYPRPEATLLVQIRKGELPYQQVAEIIENGMTRLDECMRLSTLPAEPDKTRAEQLVLDVYREAVATAGNDKR